MRLLMHCALRAGRRSSARSTLADGPFGIETQADVESAVLALCQLVEADNASDAFVIACYSDPGRVKSAPSSSG
jgi:Asp/Glu/hydantoin racemase